MDMRKSRKWTANVFSLIFFLIFASFASLSFAANSLYTIYVVGLKNNKGTVRISLYNSEATYKTRSKPASFRVGTVPIKNNQAVWQVSVPAGTYALLFFHDENNDNQFNKNFLSIPNEGYGFSGSLNSKVSVPTFSEAMFPLDSKHKSVTVHMQYW